MLKKTIKFNDLDGNPLTEDFYFHLNKAEVAEMELSQKGGLSAYMEMIVKTEDTKELVAIFKDLILKAVGRRSDDGRRFIKNQEIVDDFTQTEAYSELFMELATQSSSAIDFIKGILPAGLEDLVEKSTQKSTTDVALPSGSEVVEPAWLKEGRTPTPDEVKNATPEQLRIAFTRKSTQVQHTE